MDSKRDIRPKLASRLLKDSLVLHCLFRVSLATQHIIGTIIFLKQRKKKYKKNENKNNVLRIYTRSRPQCVARRSCVRTFTTRVTCVRHAGLVVYPALRTSTDHPSRISLATRARVPTTSVVARTLEKKNTNNENY